jgi:hypothetical protein
MFNLSILTGFLSHQRASIFLSYNECMRRIDCEKDEREECSEECKAGTNFIDNLLIKLF